MSLESGQTLSHYRLIEKIGEGGMGVVWKALDTTLDREVAIKILPEAFSTDPERLARFEREAKLLASLNHPNIAAVYSIHEADGLRFLAMELVAGEDLAARLMRGPISVDDALTIAGQIADALAAAHDSGIVHRDLKPANIQLTPNDKVKVLDFGLAKAFAPEVTPGSGDLALSPTVTSAGTLAGMVLGTAGYMSPEQTRGRPVDRRADVWAFGCVLYEMLTGRRTFDGDTVSDMIARILTAEPDPSALPATTPPGVRRVLERCLRKDPERRVRDMGDVRLELEESREATGRPDVATTSAGTRWRRSPLLVVAGVVLGLVAGAVLGVTVLGNRDRGVASPGIPTSSFEIVLPAEAPLALGSFISPLAISRDATMLAYVGFSEGVRRLFLRPMDEMESRPLPGTENAEGPFFSPDGQWIGFFADGRLQKVSVRGGAPRTVCPTNDYRGGTWGADDVIVFARSQLGPLVRVPAAGGEPQQLTALDPREPAVFSHRLPSFMPDGRQVLYSGPERGKNIAEAQLWTVNVETGATHRVLDGGVDPEYLPSKHLLFVASNSLMAAPFDPVAMQATGDAVPVLHGIASEANTGAAHFAVAPNGTLVYLPGGVYGLEGSLVWVDREGNVLSTVGEHRVYRWPGLSPDGKRLAIVVLAAGTGNLWTADAGRGDLRQLLPHAVPPLFSPDGERIVYTSVYGEGSGNMFVVASDGSTSPERLSTAEELQWPTSWSPDGTTVAFTRETGDGKSDIMLLELSGASEPRPFLATGANELGAHISPDGRFVAYTSDDSGRYEVYVVPYPSGGGKWQISTEGGTEPMWSADGSELFFRNGPHMMAAEVSAGETTFSATTPKKLFTGWYEGIPGVPAISNYAVAPDGQRFLMLKPVRERESADRLHVVLNLFGKLPTGD